MSTTKYTPRLADKYKKDVIPAMMKRFSYTSVMQVPKLEKICLNRGVNGAVTDKKLVDIAVEELTTITGQKAVSTLSKKDISNFKLRKAMPIGARVTLRGVKMYEFLDRLIATALPRVRDFKGVNEKSFDGAAILGPGLLAGGHRRHRPRRGPARLSFLRPADDAEPRSRIL